MRAASTNATARNCFRARSWTTPFRGHAIFPRLPPRSARYHRRTIHWGCAPAAKAAPRRRSPPWSTPSSTRSRTSASNTWRCRSPRSECGARRRGNRRRSNARPYSVGLDAKKARCVRCAALPKPGLPGFGHFKICRKRASPQPAVERGVWHRRALSLIELMRFLRAVSAPPQNALGGKCMSSDILTARTGPVLEITLNRPQLGNAASDAMAVELTKLLLGAGESSEIVVLRGAGEDFCVGRETMGKRPPGAPPEAFELRRRNDVVFNCYGALRRCEIPVIGVVRGRAFGFGCAIAAVCDITLAADTAKFQVPEMAHNIMPTMVMSALVDRVPRKAMTYLVWSTAVIGPQRAREAGIVSEVVPAAELDAAVDALCKQIMAAPRPARVGCKDYARAALDMDVAGAIDFARSIHAVINSSSEMLPAGHK